VAQADRPQELVRPYLDRHSARLDSALRQALAEPVLLEPGRRIQFEVCPFFYRVVLCATETEILPDDWLMDELPQGLLEQVEEAGGDSLEVVSQLVVDWIADAWLRVGGPRLYRPAFAFFHGYSEQFDLEQRRWLSVEEAFGG
jgi:hypothetical protein